MQEVYWGVPLGTAIWRGEKSRNGQREELSWQIVASEALADLKGLYQSYITLRQGDKTFILSIVQSLDRDTFLLKGKLLNRDSVGSCQPVLPEKSCLPCRKSLSGAPLSSTSGDIAIPHSRI